MTLYGYARVGVGQSLTSQQAALREAGAEKVFSETRGAVGALNRRVLQKAIKALGHGDVLLVTRLDRLARSTRELLHLVDRIAKAGAGIRSLTDTWADTTTSGSHPVATVLGGLAEFERQLFRVKTTEGIERAKAAGSQLGRPPKLTKLQRRQALRRREAGDTLRDIAATYGCSYMTISRLSHSR